MHTVSAAICSPVWGRFSHTNVIKSIYKKHTPVQILVRTFFFLVYNIYILLITNAGECRLQYFSLEVSLFCFIVNEKNSLRSERKIEKKNRRSCYWIERGSSLMKADWEHLEAVFRGRSPEWAALAFKYGSLLETKNLPAKQINGSRDLVIMEVLSFCFTVTDGQCVFKLNLALIALWRFYNLSAPQTLFTGFAKVLKCTFSVFSSFL